MSLIRTVIVDDEPLARERLNDLLVPEPDIDVIGEAGTGAGAIDAIEQLRPDLVFLDVQMPGGDGFQVLEALDPRRTPTVVFVTAYDQYALRAFDVHALDYLLKPFDGERFRTTLERMREQLRGDLHVNERLLALVEELRVDQSRRDRLVVRDGGRVFFLRAADIDWVEAAGNYVSLHIGTRTHLLRETMAHMEKRLDSGTFARIHRSTIVNLDRIRELQPDFNGDHVVLLADGTKLALGRSYRDRLQTRLGTES